jgi:hypothetical protein
VKGDWLRVIRLWVNRDRYHPESRIRNQESGIEHEHEHEHEEEKGNVEDRTEVLTSGGQLSVVSY